MCHTWLYVQSSDDNRNQPDDVGSCFSFLCQELWVMHHLLQEANNPHLQLCVQLKVLRTNTGTATTVPLQKCCFTSTNAKKDRKKKLNGKKVCCTCECLETQWRSTLRTRFVAALLITNSLSPFLWSVGKPGITFNKNDNSHFKAPLPGYCSMFYYLALRSGKSSIWIR